MGSLPTVYLAHREQVLWWAEEFLWGIDAPAYMAEDIADEVFGFAVPDAWHVRQRMPAPDSPQIFKWLKVTTHNIVRNWVRDDWHPERRAEVQSDREDEVEYVTDQPELAKQIPTAEDLYDLRQFLEAVHRELEQMPEQDRMLILGAVMEVSRAELAATTGIPKSNPSVYLKNARNKLKNRLLVEYNCIS